MSELSPNEILNVVLPIARKIGMTYGVEMSVMDRDGSLYFINGEGDVIRDEWADNGLDGQEAPCAPAKEIKNGDWLKWFGARASQAALCECLRTRK